MLQTKCDQVNEEVLLGTNGNANPRSTINWFYINDSHKSFIEVNEIIIIIIMKVVREPCFQEISYGPRTDGSILS